jgi:hypothetical protein
MATTRQTWEYVMEDISRQEQLNELGAEGWELIGVVMAAGKSYPTCYFKRPALDLREQVTLDHRQRYEAAKAAEQGSGA